jgi:hypothetical protein
MQIRWSEAGALAARCPNGSGSQQIAKYHSDLQKPACVRAGARQRRHGDVVGLRAAMGLDLGKQY